MEGQGSNIIFFISKIGGKKMDAIMDSKCGRSMTKQPHWNCFWVTRTALIRDMISSLDQFFLITTETALWILRSHREIWKNKDLLAHTPYHSEQLLTHKWEISLIHSPSLHALFPSKLLERFWIHYNYKLSWKMIHNEGRLTENNFSHKKNKKIILMRSHTCTHHG